MSASGTAPATHVRTSLPSPRDCVRYLHYPPLKGWAILSRPQSGTCRLRRSRSSDDPACDAIQLERSVDLTEFLLQILGCTVAVYRRDISAVSGAAAKRSIQHFPIFAGTRRGAAPAQHSPAHLRG